MERCSAESRYSTYSTPYKLLPAEQRPYTGSGNFLSSSFVGVSHFGPADFIPSVPFEMRNYFKPSKKCSLSKNRKVKMKRSEETRIQSCPPINFVNEKFLTEKKSQTSKEKVKRTRSRKSKGPKEKTKLPQLYKKADSKTKQNLLMKMKSRPSPVAAPPPTPSDDEESKSQLSYSNEKHVRRKKYSLVVMIKPINQETERELFFSTKFKYNPQFNYKQVIDQKLLNKFSEASEDLLPLAIKIMNVAISRHGTYEKFQEVTGGKVLSRSEIVQMAKSYLADNGLSDEINVMLSDDLVSRACMTKITGFPTIVIRVYNMREHWMHGVLRHEIGTHYLRSYNNKKQVWRSNKVRQDMGLLAMNPTEEGLASLHSVLFRSDPCLWRSAFLYYTVCMAVKMSFTELFQDLEKYVKDPMVRWDYCLRAKRGFLDTSLPGAMCKDQVYLIGALELLRHRHDIDFEALIQYGKVSYIDLDKLKDMAETKDTRLPSFMEDMTEYTMALNNILLKNGLTDNDLRRVASLSLL